MIVLAITNNQEVGVDIELINHSLPTRDLANKWQFWQLKTKPGIYCCLGSKI